ncbi:Thermophilic metalloprotease (M29) [Acetitomaculum ruminis DSM 5522]|uniref:Thermophilic metalloprotease (M29) n=1 Tax=Acetitomaculum ruminis DSM 5522 TaxID=1120918 RepID=A0A1I0V9G5_9FIRM|nr:aminopeptidase [Acetitomaculum ruminis]SFA72670.1 Thermophilic metalloprotease (M29) [Acetitomaculum ruminis DSM 5522]
MIDTISNYEKLYFEENSAASERLLLCKERLELILKETTVSETYRDYFIKTAKFLKYLFELNEDISSKKYFQHNLEELQNINKKLYEDICGENYQNSYANPKTAVKILGREYGSLLSFLYADIRGIIPDVFENRKEFICIYTELFIEIYNLFEQDENPSRKAIFDTLYWFNSDYSDLITEERTASLYSPDRDFMKKIIEQCDLSDLSYLYLSGEYVGQNQLSMARYLNNLDKDKIKLMADTITNGFREGFVLTNKDLSKKKYYHIEYLTGFEILVKKIIENLREIGLEALIYRNSTLSLTGRRSASKRGYYGDFANNQFEYDHKDDMSLYFDKPFMERKLGVLKASYEKYREFASLYAGPIVIETFGEKPFNPEIKEESLNYPLDKQSLKVEFNNKSMQLLNNYVKSSERSFSIISFPVAQIGENFDEIFDEIIKINTLDSSVYRPIHEKLIDVLNTAKYAHITGMNNNKTDLKVSLFQVNDTQKEENFENCLADVNIPLGEVFTSPVLEGTNGILNVSNVYLDGLLYKDLTIEFKDGMIVDYNCSNFNTEEENKKYIKDNILFQRETLPMGEFAIGTNTLAYVVSKKYNIENILPILIAEKTGPHFAVGDTCYSLCEDIEVHNPNGKEIVAKDNEITSKYRKTDMSKAYFNCHTDITIPYNELGKISAIDNNNNETLIIKDGKFVLEGCEKLNEVFDQL